MVLVNRLDRLARSTFDLCALVDTLHTKQVELIVASQEQRAENLRYEPWPHSFLYGQGQSEFITPEKSMSVRKHFPGGFWPPCP